jgi:hypothetical protein
MLRASAPVKKVQVEAVGPQPPQAGFARGNRASAAGILRQHLARQKHLVPPTSDCFPDDLLGSAVGIHFGSVDQREAEIDAEPQRRDLLLAPGRRLAHFPSALAEHGHGLARSKTERAYRHATFEFGA